MECGLKQIIKEIIFGQTGHWYIDLCGTWKHSCNFLLLLTSLDLLAEF